MRGTVIADLGTVAVSGDMLAVAALRYRQTAGIPAGKHPAIIKLLPPTAP
jgi:hypothetical protein